MKLRRFAEFDAIRGICALIVLILHLTQLTLLPEWLELTPLRIFWQGGAAVAIFFLLSGFVLMLPYLKNKSISYGSFMVKRTFRIYLPYLVAFLLLYLLLTLINQKAALDTGSFINQFFLVGGVSNINGAVWTLALEFRIAFIFPLLALFVRKAKFIWNFLLIIVFFALEMSLSGFNTTELLRNLALSSTFRALEIFVIGMLFAKHYTQLVQKLRQLNSRMRVLLLLFCLLVIAYTWKFTEYFGFFRVSAQAIFAIAAFLPIATFCIDDNNLKKVLNLRPFLYLGKVSYSLYLVHMIVILTLTPWLNAKMAFLPAIAITVPVIALSTLIFAYVVEFPSMRLGKYVTSKFATCARPVALI